MKLSRARLRKALTECWNIAVISDDSSENQKQANRARKEFIDEMVDAMDKPKKRAKTSTTRNTIRTLIRKKKP